MYSTLIHLLYLQATSLGIGRTLESSKGLGEQTPMQAAIEWMGCESSSKPVLCAGDAFLEEEKHLIFIHMAEKGVTY